MDNLALEKLINEANLLLVRAENELKKPQKEMLPFAACQTAKCLFRNKVYRIGASYFVC